MKKKSKKIGGSYNSGKCLKKHLDSLNVSRVADIIEEHKYTLYVLHIKPPENIRENLRSYLEATMRFSDIKRMIYILYSSFRPRDEDIYSAYGIIKNTKSIFRKGSYKMSDHECEKRIQGIDNTLELVEKFLPRYYNFLMIKHNFVTNVSFIVKLNSLLVGIPNWTIVYF